jgi:uncharacterized membrane protein
MLKYLIQVMQNLLTTAVLLALLFALARLEGKAMPRQGLLAGSGAGILLALIIAILRTSTRLINREYLNIGFLSAAILAALLFYALVWKLFPRKTAMPGNQTAKTEPAAQAGPAALAESTAQAKKTAYLEYAVYGALAAGLLLYALPGIFLYPAEFVLPGESVFSTDFLFKLIGYLAGLLVVGLSGLALYKTGAGLSFKTVRRLTTLGLGVNMINQLAAIVQPLLARRIIPMRQWLFALLKPIINYNDWFLYALLILTLVLPLALWVESLRSGEIGENPAQHRKIKAAARRQRRWCAVVLAGYVLAVLSLTVIQAYSQREVVLSPVEPINIVGQEILIPLENVSDGHLHRYAYTASDGTEVRFIVIQKNAAAYGVGLDACDICGPTGYYERKDQVICKLCDVVMNKSTIGFKGGCNPVPLAYTVRQGQMIILVKNLENEKKRFA